LSERALTPLYDIALGSAWAGSSVNCKTYATEPLVFARLDDGREVIFGAFFDAAGDLVCYRWQAGGDALRTVKTTVPDAPVDAHFTASVQVDCHGTLHIVGGAHRNRPFHFLWHNGGDAETLVDDTASLPGEMRLASYPSLLRVGTEGDKNDLYLLYRLGLPHRSQWRVIRRRAEGGWAGSPWTLITGVSSTLWSAGPYPNQPLVFADGRVGLAYCWRSHRVERGRLDPMNIGLDYAEYSEGLSIARTSDGLRLSMPVSPGNSETILPVRWGSGLSNQSGGAVLSDGTPAFAAAWREPSQVRQIHFCWRDRDGHWRTRSVTRFTKDHAMRGLGTLPAPYSRPAVVPAPGGRAIVVYRDDVAGGRLVAQLLSPPNFDPAEHPPVTLVAGGLDQYEPAVERLGALSSGLLVCYIQSAEQVLGGDSEKRLTGAPARLIAWDIGLGQVSTPKAVSSDQPDGA
jgi:hypothetical protein